MWARLALAPGPRFSKTARSRPRLHEARRHGSQVPGPPPIGGRRLADDLGEGPAERPQAREAHVEADLGNAALGLTEHEHRPLDAAALQVAVRRLAEGRAKDADEVRLGDVGDPRQRRDVERLGVVAVHRVAGAKHAAVRLFDGPAHAGSVPTFISVVVLPSRVFESSCSLDDLVPAPVSLLLSASSTYAARKQWRYRQWPPEP